MKIYRHTDGSELQRVATIDYEDDGLAFLSDQRILWRTKAGNLVTSRGANCECETPHQDNCKMTDLYYVDFDELLKEAEEVLDRIFPPVPTTVMEATKILADLKKEDELRIL